MSPLEIQESETNSPSFPRAKSGPNELGFWRKQTFDIKQQQK